MSLVLIIFPSADGSRPRNICNNFSVRGPRYYYQGHTFNCPVQGFVSFVTVASLNQRKLIVVSEYCLAPVTVSVVFLLCDPLALHIIHTCFSHRVSIFFSPTYPPTHTLHAPSLPLLIVL